MKQYEIKVKPVPPVLVSPSKARLTETEKVVVEKLAAGLCNKEIGTQLNVAERTIKFHVSQILLKTGLKDRHEVVAWWTHDHVEGLDRWHLLTDQMKEVLALYGAGCRFRHIAKKLGMGTSRVAHIMLAIRLTLQLKDTRSILAYAASRGQIADVNLADLEDKIVIMRNGGGKKRMA